MTQTQSPSRHYIGRDKPLVTFTYEPWDKYTFAREKAAKTLHMNPDELADEPDFNTRIDIDRE